MLYISTFFIRFSRSSSRTFESLRNKTCGEKENREGSGGTDQEEQLVSGNHHWANIGSLRTREQDGDPRGICISGHYAREKEPEPRSRGNQK